MRIPHLTIGDHVLHVSARRTDAVVVHVTDIAEVERGLYPDALTDVETVLSLRANLADAAKEKNEPP